MKKVLAVLCLVGAATGTPAATTNIGPWTPLFKGIEHTFVGVVSTITSEQQAINCLRIELTDPDISLFTTPHCTNCTRETVNQNTSHFLETYGLQVAVNGNFSSPSDGDLGNPVEVFGLAISQGNWVSPQLLDDGEHNPLTVLLFTTNNGPTFIASNWPPVDTTGIYTAVGGTALLADGVNVAGNDDSDDPRTALGISQDKRYLFMMTVDGRNDGWSDGVTVFEAAEWLAYFGAYNAVNLDGGGSTTMVMADCEGKAARLNIPSYVLEQGRERRTGHNFGVYAKPLLSGIKDLAVKPGATTALLTWRTDFDATTQVEYGLTTNYGAATAFDSRLVKTHVATLHGLEPGTNYFFRVLSSGGLTQHSFACRTATTNAVLRATIFEITNQWKYTTNNLDDVNWQARAYDDRAWLGPGPGLLYVESDSSVTPRNTLMPPGTGASTIPRSYYFRTRFQFTGSATGTSLMFSNLVDDGAVFYLNGVEIYRLRMEAPPALITNLSYAIGIPCQGTADAGDAIPACYDLFTISGDLLTNLVQGENVLAVEVHNYSSGADLVFGSALIMTQPGLVLPLLSIAMTGDLATLYWNGEGFTLQQTSDIASSNSWMDVPGPVNSSPAALTKTGTVFYRLRR